MKSGSSRDGQTFGGLLRDLRICDALVLLVCPQNPGVDQVQDDVQSGCDEGNWFQAEKHRSEIRSFLRGPGNSERFAMIDLFGASGQMSKRWRKAGWDAFAYDIKTSKAHDVTSADGFWALCSAGKRLMTNGLIFGGPPCSLYVWISKSVHKRSEDNAFVGDTGLYKVRMSNRIVANMCVFLQELSECKAARLNNWTGMLYVCKYS